MLFQMPHLDRCVIRVCLGVCLALTACLASTTDISSAIPTCMPPIPNANPYTSHEITEGVKAIYRNSLNNLGSARQDALFQLGQNMEHWSDHVDIVNDNAHMVRITVTYLDPALIEYIMLNYLINRPDYLTNIINNSPMNEQSFNFELSSTLQRLGERNEMLFIVMVTSPFYQQQAFNNTDLTVKFSADQLTLSSASNTQVKPTHFDRILKEGMDITQGPVSGIVGFPLALENQDQCNLVIDQWTNTLTLDIPSVTLGANNHPPKFWSIPYRSLVLQSDTHPTPTYDANALNSSINKLDEPPTPSWTPNPAIENTSQTYWENMGRYIWNLVITESHH